MRSPAYYRIRTIVRIAVWGSALFLFGWVGSQIGIMFIDNFYNLLP